MNGELNFVGQWYLRRDLDQIFQVTGYDDRYGTIEIQTFDGDVDEIEEDSWRALPLVSVEAPKDWTGPLDGVELEEANSSSDDRVIDVSAGPKTWRDLAGDDELDFGLNDWMDWDKPFATEELLVA